MTLWLISSSRLVVRFCHLHEDCHASHHAPPYSFSACTFARVARSGAGSPNVVIILRGRPGLQAILSINGNTNLPHASHVDSLANGGAVRAVLRPTPVLAHARGVPHGAVATPRRRPRRVHRARSDSTSTNAPWSGSLQSGGLLRTACFGKEAHRVAVAVPPERPRLRRVLRLHLSGTGASTSTRRSTTTRGREGQGLHHRRPHRPRDRRSLKANATCG